MDEDDAMSNGGGETETWKTMGLFILVNFYGSLSLSSSDYSFVRQSVQSVAQKLPTLLNHHFLKPQLPFAVKMVRLKKPPRRIGNDYKSRYSVGIKGYTFH